MDHQINEFNFHFNTFADHDCEPWFVDQKIYDNLMSVEQVQCLFEMESKLNDAEELFVGTITATTLASSSSSNNVVVNLSAREKNTNLPDNLSAILENNKQVPAQEQLLEASASLDVAQSDCSPTPPTTAVVFNRIASQKKSSRSRSRTISGKNVQASPRRVCTKATLKLPVPKPTKKKKSPEPFVLPPGWGIDYKVRQRGVLKGHIVKYFLEPDQGDGIRKRFKSLPDVEFYIEHGYRRPVKCSKRRKVGKGSSKPTSPNPDALDDEEIHIFARELEADMLLSSGLFEDDVDE
ncbi:hypothetical protein C5167_026779 [Papaver somniferum]|nr:hypothetical protein C5167_026779 [Papaver somniferum]